MLDQLNAWLRPHGLWYPVDVSTSAQCTLGGMAGNNSCGSRSIRYGNMVHNVASIDAMLADGQRARFGVGPAGGHAAGSAAPSPTRWRHWPSPSATRSSALYPKVLRRVGGYNLDIFFPQSERPYTLDNSVNLAHLLVGSEGTLAVTERLTLKLAPLPRHKALGVVNFPSFYKAMDSAQHIVRLKPTAVELVDRTMIELARANPAFRPVIERALIGKPEAILLVEFAGEEREPQLRDLARLVELMGDLGLPGSVVEMAEPQAAGRAVGGAQGRPQHHDVDEGRRKAGVLHRGLRGAAGAPRGLHAAPHRRLHQARHARHLVRPRLGRHAACAADPRHAPRRAPRRCARSPRRPRPWCANTRAPTRASTATGWCARNGWPGSSGRGSPRRSRRSRTCSIRAGLLNPGKIVRPSRMDDRSLFRFKPGYANVAYKPALDWSAWNVQNDPLTEQLTAPGSGGDPTGGFAKAAEMCNNNGHCRKFDAGTMCPSFRVTRDEVHLTRGRANTLRLALSGQLGPARLTSDAVAEAHGSLRELQGLQARLPDRRRHGAHEDRGEVGAPHEQGPQAARPPDRWPAGDRTVGAPPALAVQHGVVRRSPIWASPSSAACRRWRSDTFLATTDVDDGATPRW